MLARKRANTRRALVLRVMFVSLYSLGDGLRGLASREATPMIGVLLRWSRVLWQSPQHVYARTCALMSLSLVQSALKFNLELAEFFKAYSCAQASRGLGLVATLTPQRKKRFFFVKHRPKRFILWYWGAVLSQYMHTPTLQRKPFTVLRVLHPVSFFLKKRKLGRYRV